MTINGIIIRVTPYKDYGAMINLLTNNGQISFYAENVFKNKNKNNFLSSALSIGDFTFSDNVKGKLLTFKEVNLQLDTRIFLGNPRAICLLNLFQETTSKFMQDEDEIKLYENLKKYLININRAENLLLLASSYLAKILSINGLALNVNSCVLTGQKDNIIGLSLKDGGFVCKKAFNKKEHIFYSEEKIDQIKALFTLDITELLNLKFKKRDCLDIFNDLIVYIKETTNTDIKSGEMLKKII